MDQVRILVTAGISGLFFPPEKYSIKVLISFQVPPVSAESVSCLISKREMEKFNTPEGKFISEHIFLLLNQKIHYALILFIDDFISEITHEAATPWN